MAYNDPTAYSPENYLARMMRQPLSHLFAPLMVIGLITFLVGLMIGNAQRMWQSYLINFMLWSGMAQGAVLFSAVMHVVKARWHGPVANLAAVFGAFFPVSMLLYLFLFAGYKFIFPWLEMDLHGKEAWLNVPFLFGRNLMGLLILHGIGLVFLFHDLWFKLDRGQGVDPARIGTWRRHLYRLWERYIPDADTCRRRMAIFGVVYCVAFTVILSLIGYDLVMATDPHWYSTLFGAYTFVKAFFIGLGALIILGAVLHLSPQIEFTLSPDRFHDMGKLFFAFCLVWADFFYCQFVVIWYGNISEETAYIIERTMHSPWQYLAWFIFIVVFIGPFFILINKKIKTRPRAMVVLCAVVVLGIWLEHLLLVGPAFYPHTAGIPLGLSDGLIFLGFLGLMAATLIYGFRLFPELLQTGAGSSNRQQ